MHEHAVSFCASVNIKGRMCNVVEEHHDILYRGIELPRPHDTRTTRPFDVVGYIHVLQFGRSDSYRAPCN